MNDTHNETALWRMVGRFREQDPEFSKLVDILSAAITTARQGGDQEGAVILTTTLGKLGVLKLMCQPLVLDSKTIEDLAKCAEHLAAGHELVAAGEEEDAKDSAAN